MIIKQSAKGFTLIELLAVLFVIGIVMSFVTLSVSSGARSYEIKSAAKRLYAVTSLALEEAIITNSQYGLLFDHDPDSEDVHQQDYLYQWLVLDYETNRWVPVDNHEILTEKKLPPGIRLEIEIEDRPIIIGTKKEEQSMFADINIIEDEEEEEDEPQVKLQPDIYFMSSGELLPFRIKLSESKEGSPTYQIKGDMIGRIRLIKPGDDEEDI